MKKIIFAALVLIFSTGTVYGAEQTLGQWIKSTAGRIERSSKERKPRSTATAGVKGAEEKLDEGIYWKKDVVSDVELTDFKAAVSLAEAGKNAEAKSAMEAFIKKYPSSELAKDAREGIRLIDAAGEKKPAEKQK